jgi:hypothetical protein
MAKMTNKTREAIASLSTGGVGTYYTSPGAFFTRLEWVLREEGFEGVGDYPAIHTSEGGGRIEVVLLGMETPLFDVVYNWYRMPSGNWEMICYPTC